MLGFEVLRKLTPPQRNAFLAAFLGWTLDAFDYFVLVFVMKDIAAEFHVSEHAVAYALMLTLACRPIGALLFGMAADRYGRRIPLMVNIVCYSAINLVCGFSPNLTVLFVLRALFGIAMGGEWGLGASLAMETIPPESRGFLSGLLQEGYSTGYLLAAVAYGLVFPVLGWRWMFFIGALPALLSLFIRTKVQESPAWEEENRRRKSAAGEGRPRVPLALGPIVRQHGRLFLYLVVLMTAFTFMSHGSQDVYPTFLQKQHHYKPGVVSSIAIIYNVGALLGGMYFGGLSQRVGRRRAIMTAALLALPIIPLWAFSHSIASFALGGFLMQFMVQGAWGIIPAHLSELSPNIVRGTFTGLAYQLGNLLSSANAPLQTYWAARLHGNYAVVMSIVMTIVLLSVAIVTGLGKEARDVRF